MVCSWVLVLAKTSVSVELVADVSFREARVVGRINVVSRFADVACLVASAISAVDTVSSDGFAVVCSERRVASRRSLSPFISGEDFPSFFRNLVFSLLCRGSTSSKNLSSANP